MRQRTKVAAALVTDPQVLVLDEPLNGADPVQRVHLIALFKQLGADGRTVIVSSHVLNEVERMAERVIVLVHGRLAAAGGHRAIRDAMDDTPRHVFVRADDGRRLAAALVGLESVAGVTFEHEAGRTRDPDAAGARAGDGAPRVARDGSIRLLEVRPLDDSLESLFRELVRLSATTDLAAGRAAAATRRSALPRDPRLHPAIVLPAEALDGDRCSPASGALLFGLLAHAVHRVTAERAFADVAAEGIFGLVMPIAALVIGDSVLGAEVRAGTFHFTWLSPAPTWQIVLGRWLGGSAVALVTIAPATALAAFVAGAPGGRRTGVPRRRRRQRLLRRDLHRHRLPSRDAPPIWSLAFVFLFERLLGAALTGIAQLSPTWESRAIFVGLLDDPPSG